MCCIVNDDIWTLAFRRGFSNYLVNKSVKRLTSVKRNEFLAKFSSFFLSSSKRLNSSSSLCSSLSSLLVSSLPLPLFSMSCSVSHLNLAVFFFGVKLPLIGDTLERYEIWMLLNETCKKAVFIPYIRRCSVLADRNNLFQHIVIHAVCFNQLKRSIKISFKRICIAWNISDISQV